MVRRGENGLTNLRGRPLLAQANAGHKSPDGVDRPLPAHRVPTHYPFQNPGLDHRRLVHALRPDHLPSIPSTLWHTRGRSPTGFRPGRISTARAGCASLP